MGNTVDIVRAQDESEEDAVKAQDESEEDAIKAQDESEEDAIKAALVEANRLVQSIFGLNNYLNGCRAFVILVYRILVYVSIKFCICPF